MSERRVPVPPPAATTGNEISVAAGVWQQSGPSLLPGGHRASPPQLGCPRQHASSRLGLGTAPPCGAPGTRAETSSASRGQQRPSKAVGGGQWAGALWVLPVVAPRPRAEGRVSVLRGQCCELPAPSQSRSPSPQQGPPLPSLGLLSLRPPARSLSPGFSREPAPAPRPVRASQPLPPLPRAGRGRAQTGQHTRAGPAGSAAGGSGQALSPPPALAPCPCRRAGAHGRRHPSLVRPTCSLPSGPAGGPQERPSSRLSRPRERSLLPSFPSSRLCQKS